MITFKCTSFPFSVRDLSHLGLSHCSKKLLRYSPRDVLLPCKLHCTKRNLIQCSEHRCGATLSGTNCCTMLDSGTSRHQLLVALVAIIKTPAPLSSEDHRPFFFRIRNVPYSHACRNSSLAISKISQSLHQLSAEGQSRKRGGFTSRYDATQGQPPASSNP